MSLVLHLALLAVAITSLAGASLRCAARVVTALDARILGAAALGAGFAIAESLILGLTGHGGNPLLLTSTAVGTWVVCRLLVAAPVTAIRDQLAAAWTGSAPMARGGIGALASLTIGLSIFQMTHPRIEWDGAVDHVAQPALWITDGHPGSLHQTIVGFPTQAYPKSFEVMVFWVSAISRTMVGIGPLSIAVNLLGVIAMLIGLRRVGCGPVVSALATAAAMWLPWSGSEFGSPLTDVPALAFLVVAVTLCVIAKTEPGAFGLAVLAAGVSIGIKTPTVPIALIAIAWTAYYLRRQLRPHVASLVALGGFGSALGLLWYVVNAVVYHAPLWPFSRWPAGPPPPSVFTTYGRRFIAEPIKTLRLVGWHNYLHYLGGAPVLLAAVPVFAALAFLPSQRTSRRVILAGSAVVLIQTVLFASQELTGVAGESILFALSTLRYFDEVPVAAAAVLALATRRRGYVRRTAITVLCSALAINIVETRRSVGGLFPPLAICAALALIGAIVGVINLRIRWVAAAFRQSGFASVLVMACTLLASLPASSYLENYVTTAYRTPLDESPVLRYLKTQTSWVHGTAPVAAGYAAFATFAGPDFTHPLSYVPRNEPCAALHAAARSGWLILWREVANPFAPVRYTWRTNCMAGLAPVKTIAGRVRIYAPPSLVTRAKS